MAAEHRKGTTKSQGNKSDLDKFYTKPETAARCLALLDLDSYDIVIEPSAGSGAFSSQMPGCIALDLEPEGPGIRKQDWFEFRELEREAGRRILVAGNPPFGTNGNLAVRFINHAATFADTVAFILPQSFRKYSVQARIDRHLHRDKARQVMLPAGSFTLDGEDYGVPCVFQVWEWKEELRELPERRLTTPYFAFVDRSEGPDCRIQRVGGNAGRADLNTDYSPASNYFIAIDTDELAMTPQEFVDYVNSLEFPGRDLGVGPRTLSKDELVGAFEAGLRPEHLVE